MPITISRDEKSFTVTAHVGEWQSQPVKVELADNFRFNIGQLSSLGFINTQKHIEVLFTLLYESYVPTKFTVTKKTDRYSKQLQVDKIKQSIVKRQGFIHCKKLKVEFDRLRLLCDQDWLKIERMCFNIFGPKKFLTVFHRILDYFSRRPDEHKKYFVADLMKYRAIYYLIAEYGRWRPDWIAHYSQGSNVYVRQTLMNFPNALLTEYVRLDYFQNKIFHKPLNRTECLFFLISCDPTIGRGGSKQGLLATSKEIIKAAKLYKKHHAGIKLDLRKKANLVTLFRYIEDFPQWKEHKGSLVGLMRKSIYWHRNNRYTKLVSGLDPKQKCVEPPEFIRLAIANREDVKFLSTVEEVGQEGVNMHHCIGGYAKNAVEGRCFLFHVEKYGEQASVEVNYSYRFDDSGKEAKQHSLRVAQSRGPHNHLNKASKWAEKFFNKILQKEYGQKDAVATVKQEEEIPW